MPWQHHDATHLASLLLHLAYLTLEVLGKERVWDILPIPHKDHSKMVQFAWHMIACHSTWWTPARHELIYEYDQGWLNLHVWRRSLDPAWRCREAHTKCHDVNHVLLLMWDHQHICSAKLVGPSFWRSSYFCRVPIPRHWAFAVFLLEQPATTCQPTDVRKATSRVAHTALRWENR